MAPVDLEVTKAPPLQVQETRDWFTQDLSAHAFFTDEIKCSRRAALDLNTGERCDVPVPVEPELNH